MDYEPINKATDKMEKSLKSLGNDLGSVRAGRANPKLLDRITVDYYGTMTQTAIYNFQKANGMMPDGVCGTATQNLLFSGSAVTFGDYLAAGGLEYSARDEVINQLIAYSKNYIGCPYVWAGAGPRVFDCSGYTMYIFRHFGYSFGHGCSVQSTALGAQLSMSALLPPYFGVRPQRSL